MTSFEFGMNPIGPHVMAGPIFWPMEDAPKVLRFYREWIDDCPDELTTIIVQRRLPALSTVPRHLVGKRVVAVVACYTGSIEAGESGRAAAQGLRLTRCSTCASRSRSSSIRACSTRRLFTATGPTSDPAMWPI